MSAVTTIRIRRGIALSIGVGTIAVSGLALWGAHRGGSDTSSAAVQNASPTVTHVDNNKGVIPGYQNLTEDQILDRSMSVGGMRGMVRGSTGAAVAHLIHDRLHPSGIVVTDYPFLVQAFYGRGSAPYALGTSIVLRIPGGTVPDASGRPEQTTVEDAPSLAMAAEYFVAVRDQGEQLGGSSASVLVATDVSDVYPVHDGSVTGEGSLASWSESIDRFVAHFH